MDEKEIVNLMTSEFSWEQIIYRVIAWEGLDPWDLDVSKLSDAFVDYLTKLEELDFKIPAKYVIIAAVLIRMKTDHLHFLRYFDQENYVTDEFGSLEEPGKGEGQEIAGSAETILGKFEVNPITVPNKRLPKSKIVVDDLVLALRNVLRAQGRKDMRIVKSQEMIKIREDNITKRIGKLYDRINDILGRIKNDEVKFSGLVDRWERQEVVNTFLPLIFLENEKKVECRQDEPFEEIYIKTKEQNIKAGRKK